MEAAQKKNGSLIDKYVATTGRKLSMRNEGDIRKWVEYEVDEAEKALAAAEKVCKPLHVKISATKTRWAGEDLIRVYFTGPREKVERAWDKMGEQGWGRG